MEKLINDMYCKNCGKKINSRAKFCKYCGKEIKKKIEEGEFKSSPLAKEERDQTKSFFYSLLFKWNIEEKELKNQVDNYDTLGFPKSLRKISSAVMIFILVVTSVLILLGSIPVESWIDVILILILIPLIYKGNKWALIAAIVYWVFSKFFSIYQIFYYEEFNFTGLLSNIFFLLFFTKIFWQTYQVEKEKDKTIIKKKKKIERIVIIILLIILGIIIINNLYNNRSSSIVPMLNQKQISAVVLLACSGGNNIEKNEFISIGSGVIINPEGTIFTNRHVVSNEDSSVIKSSPTCYVGFTDDISQPPQFKYLANLVAYSPLTDDVFDFDIAVLEIYDVCPNSESICEGAPLSLPTSFSYLNLGYSGELNPGSHVRIGGYPGIGGGTFNLTQGIISGKVGDFVLKTDAKIDQGNSGGAAFDSYNNLIGIPTWFIKGEAESIGYIIEIDDIYEWYNQKVLLSDSIVVPFGFGKIIETSEDSGGLDTDEVLCSEGCYFNGKCILNPPDSYCVTDDPNNAWKCNAGLVESNSFCINCDIACIKDYPGSKLSYYDENSDTCICDCPIGYEWNVGRTACAIRQKTSDEKCKDFFGQNSYWDGTYCSCISGYVWNKSGNTCITRNAGCQESWPNTYWSGKFSSDGEYLCDCLSGYVWNYDNTMCVTRASIDQACQRDYGSYSYYLGYVEDGKYVCKTY